MTYDTTLQLLQVSILFTAVTPMDYGSLSSQVLSFDTCDTQHCEVIPIVDDLTLEQEETLSVVLERTEGLHTRISLVRINGQISILDNDGRTYIWVSISFLLVFE